MSEPLSSTEIEDVLSSIRRLVSDDLRPLPRTQSASPPPVSADKLILTPALRVVQPDVPPAAVSAPYRLHLGIPAQAASPGLNQVVASVGAAVDAQSLEWEAETGDPMPLAQAAVPNVDWQDIGAEAPFFDAEGVSFDDAGDVLHTAPTGDELVAEPVEMTAPLPGWAQQEPDQPGDLTADEIAEPLFSHGTIEPDPAWADAAEAIVIASLAEDVMGDDQAEPVPQFEDEPMLFDEEVLRELVRDILREELAGRMGERITSNIRKLVRAEIARSFATQEFE